MMGKPEPARVMPADLFDDERTWLGDNDPYLAALAREGHRHRAPPPASGPRLHGPADDGDPYPAELARAWRSRDD